MMETGQDSKAMVSENAQAQHSDREKWLSGAKVLLKTGISKTDLVKFIKMGVLPKSKIRICKGGPDGNRQTSYFSSSLLNQVARLRQLREKGYSAAAIAAEWQKTAVASPEMDDLASSATDGPPLSKKPLNVDALKIRLPGDTANASAFFVNKGLRIVWIEASRDDDLTGTISDELDSDPDGTVFSVLLRVILKERIANWQPILAFIYAFLKRTTPLNIFRMLAPKISIDLSEVDQVVLPADHEESLVTIDSRPLRFVDACGRKTNRRLYGIALSEGTLFVVDDDRWPDGGGNDDRKKTKSQPRIGSHGDLKRIPFSILSARLNESHKIVEALLPKTYFQMITNIWDEIDQVVASHGGHRITRGGNEIQFIIPKSRHTQADSAFIAIRCAIDLRLKMREVEASLRSDGVWIDALHLNIGISSGKDYMLEADPTTCMAFILPGGASDQADQLSAIGCGGTIWMTKSAFSHLTHHQAKQVTFGVFQDDKLIPNIFTTVTEFPNTPGKPSLGQETRPLSATRIIDFRPIA